MTATDPQSEANFRYLLTSVLRQVEDSGIMKALKYEEIGDAYQLLDLKLDDIRNLSYIDESGECTTLTWSESMLLGLLRRFLELNAAKYSYDFMAMTYDDFDEFCIKLGILLSYEYGDLLNQVDNSPSPSVPVTQNDDSKGDLNFATDGEDDASVEHRVKSTSRTPYKEYLPSRFPQKLIPATVQEEVESEEDQDKPASFLSTPAESLPSRFSSTPTSISQVDVSAATYNAMAPTQESHGNINVEDTTFYNSAADLAEIPIDTDPPNDDIELQKSSMYDSKELSDEDPNVNLNSYSLDNLVNFCEADKECNRKIFVHLIKNVLGCTTESHLFKALETKGIRNVQDFMTVSDHAIDTLSYKDKRQKSVQISLYNKDCLQMLRDYVRDKRAFCLDTYLKDYNEKDFDAYQRKYSLDYAPMPPLRDGPNIDDEPDSSLLDATTDIIVPSPDPSTNHDILMYATQVPLPHEDEDKMSPSVNTGPSQVSPPNPVNTTSSPAVTLLPTKDLDFIVVGEDVASGEHQVKSTSKTPCKEYLPSRFPPKLIPGIASPTPKDEETPSKEYLPSRFPKKLIPGIASPTPKNEEPPSKEYLPSRFPQKLTPDIVPCTFKHEPSDYKNLHPGNDANKSSTNTLKEVSNLASSCEMSLKDDVLTYEDMRDTSRSSKDMKDAPPLDPDI